MHRLYESSHSSDTQRGCCNIYLVNEPVTVYEKNINSVIKSKALESLSLDIAKGLEFLMKKDQVIEQLLQDFARANVIITACFVNATLVGVFSPQIIGGHVLMCVCFKI